MYVCMYVVYHLNNYNINYLIKFSFHRVHLTDTMDSIHFVREQESLVKGSLSLGIYAVLIFMDKSKEIVFNMV